MRLVFDVETDGLLQDLTCIHCLVTQDLDTGEVFRYDDSGTQESITTGINILATADELWGHNIIQYDFEALKKVYPFWKFKGKAFDTLIMSRLFFTDLLNRDFRNKPANMPAQLYGRHSLEAWGHRLGIHKSEFGKSLSGDWSTYSPEMLDYCTQDVAVSVEVSKLFDLRVEQYAACIETEHRCAEIMAWQERMGFPFDTTKALQLDNKLRTELDALSDEMRNTFQLIDGGPFIPARDNRTKGYVKGAKFTKLKEFNPTSRDHIAWAFNTHRGWEPKERTNTGRPKIDHTVLEEIGTDEAKKFARILELQKHLGMLSEGTNAWLKLERKGIIHHACFLNTNTGRNCHVKPNLAQTPSAPEYRELFYPGRDRVQVGADASGLELRCLGHYLYPFDQGAFATEVVQGDIHTKLAEIYGTDRKSGKSCTYCLIYGGGDTKLGLTAGASKKDAAKKGKEIRSRIMEGLTGFAELSAAIAERSQSDVLKGIDGRPIRLQGKVHASLNYLLQSMGAVICKNWVLSTHEFLQEAGIDYYPMAFVHDEIQLSVNPNQAVMAGQLMQMAMKDVQHQLKVRCELDSEFIVGKNWAECH